MFSISLGGFVILCMISRLACAEAGSNVSASLLQASYPFSPGVSSTVECAWDPVYVLMSTLAAVLRKSWRSDFAAGLGTGRWCGRVGCLCGLRVRTAGPNPMALGLNPVWGAGWAKSRMPKGQEGGCVLVLMRLTSSPMWW